MFLTKQNLSEVADAIRQHKRVVGQHIMAEVWGSEHSYLKDAEFCHLYSRSVRNEDFRSYDNDLITVESSLEGFLEDGEVVLIKFPSIVYSSEDAELLAKVSCQRQGVDELDFTHNTAKPLPPVFDPRSQSNDFDPEERGWD